MFSLVCATLLPALALGAPLRSKKSAARPIRPAGVRLISLHGEVGLKRDASGTDVFEPQSAPVGLARRDEVETRAGTAEVRLDSGMVLEVLEGSLVALIGGRSGIDAFVARGGVIVHAPKGGEARSVQLGTRAGRLTVRAKSARLRVQDESAVIMVYDGAATLWGRGAVLVKSGQSARLARGGPPSPPRPLLPLPAWTSTDGLYLSGDRPPHVTLHWQGVPGAARYHVDLSTAEDGAAVPGGPGGIEVESPHTAAEIADLPVANYRAHVSAVGADGALGQRSDPLRVVVAGLSGLSPAGMATVASGTAPRLTAPAGLSGEVLVDGERLGQGGLRAGTHHLKVSVDGLIAEVALLAPAGREERSPNDHPQQRIPRRPPAERPDSDRPDISRPPFLGGASAEGARQAPRASGGPSEYTFERPRDVTDHPPLYASPPDDVLLDGPSEVPGGGVRTPWADSLVQVRLESTTSGEARLAVHGRLVLWRGFGGEVDFSALRASLTGAAATSYGNLRFGLRSPALRREHLAIQGVVFGLAPISGSTLDSTPVLPPSDVTSPRRDGDWRVEGAVLVGVTLHRLALSTQQGISLGLGGGSVQPAYQGGLLLSAAVIDSLRILATAEWNVNYLGVALETGDKVPDAGGAVGGGVEVFIPARLGGVRIAALGRAGLGNAGALVYGRGSFGLQVGYRFR